MKVSNCCGVGPENDYGICPHCKEHCDWIEEGDELEFEQDERERVDKF